MPVLPAFLYARKDLTEHIETMRSVRGGCILAELEQWVVLRTELSGCQNHRCCWCGTTFSEELNSTHYPTVEHVVPKALGGSNDPTNLAVACKRCNLKRKTKAPDEFLAIVQKNGWAHPRMAHG